MTVASGIDLAATPPEPSTRPALSARIGSLDLWRGVVMVLMAIDHVRVYSGVPAGGPTAGVFFTRWVTHFCAPGFVFLALIGSFLMPVFWAAVRGSRLREASDGMINARTA